MAEENKHAILSASASHRWLECTPSARLEQEFSEQSTIASKEGTAAHELGAHKIMRKLCMESERPVSEFNNDEMEAYTEDYADFVVENYERAKRHYKDAQIFIETKLDFSCWVQDGFGTGDAVIVTKGRLHIIDLKYGQGVVVNAVKNSQMMLYALGALKRYEKEYEIKKVRMTIFQPRRENIATWETSVYQLKRWATKVLRPKAELAFRGEGEYHPNSVTCQFCRAANKCRARAEANLKIAQQEFKKPELMSDAELSDIIRRIPEFRKWIDELWDYATEKALNGYEWTGLKVVEGRSTRKFKDEKQVEEVCLKNGYRDIYKLKTLTELEKQLGKKNFNDTLGDLVEKKAGKPTLVEDSDPRPAVNNVNIEFGGKQNE